MAFLCLHTNQCKNWKRSSGNVLSDPVLNQYLRYQYLLSGGPKWFRGRECVAARLQTFCFPFSLLLIMIANYLQFPYHLSQSVKSKRICVFCANTLLLRTHTNKVSLLGNWVPSASWGPTLPLLLRSSSAPLSRGNALLSGGRAHNGTSHNATYTGPYTRPEEQSANQTLSGPSPRRQSSIVVQEEDRGNNNQSPWLSDFSSCPLLLFSIQSGPNTTTSSLRAPQGTY